MTTEQQLPEEEQNEEQETSLDDTSGDDTCLGQARPTELRLNGHWECTGTGWVWYDDIG